MLSASHWPDNTAATRSRGGGFEDANFRVHRVKAVAPLPSHEDRARAIIPNDRVARILLPMDQVPGSGDAGAPVFPGFVGVGVVEDVINTVSLDDLIDRHGVL